MDRPAEEIDLESAVLRRWRGTDLAALHRVVTESLPHLRPWMPWAAGDYSLESAAAFLQKAQDNWHTGRAFTYAITVGGTIAGCISLERRIGPTGLEIGYWLHPGHTGRGLVTTAAAALVDRALALPGIDHVEIWHDAGNTASGAVPQRLGFTCVDRRSPPRELPTSPGEAGIDVIWRLTR
ncbi:Protein N-acetyltransferase, RimJ/RimL family [Saccharopolyspora kobensis]|uniref:Protein N-acetyltransferase, RimJ/RimL family n=1 Tax=Saccharopolyspora kobensis TaxID=146035 RepID=A0A1H5WM85_9PSEU|nr:GNAT family N-acetyltransferase [Saccharopolyspora kobensis]SEG00584.1 Protein N-acetyltransferase, RimJ/RimL family [Saccharopolyspora kobensis]SFD77345.1 Protein N-acetyltransferase, RimJ/RimL family [Saccharopolyspora kobensis]